MFKILSVKAVYRSIYLLVVIVNVNERKTTLSVVISALLLVVKNNFLYKTF